MFKRALLLLLLFCGQGTVWSVRLVELRVPIKALEGGSVILGCKYEMDGEDLYSVKWYKDKEQFYRYEPKNKYHTQSYKRPGVNVNMARSSNIKVVLENLTRESEGEYACEVTGEAPGFKTATKAKQMFIYQPSGFSAAFPPMGDKFYGQTFPDRTDQASSQIRAAVDQTADSSSKQLKSFLYLFTGLLFILLLTV